MPPTCIIVFRVHPYAYIIYVGPLSRNLEIVLRLDSNVRRKVLRYLIPLSSTSPPPYGVRGNPEYDKNAEPHRVVALSTDSTVSSAATTFCFLVHFGKLLSEKCVNSSRVHQSSKLNYSYVFNEVHLHL
jgi:hypothetical protein